MKQLAVVLCAFLLLNACSKDQVNSHQCPTLKEQQVPNEVKAAFNSTFPGNVVHTWYKKENLGFGAAFNNNDTNSIAYFDNCGSLITLRMMQPSTGQYQNSSSNNINSSDSTHNHSHCTGHHHHSELWKLGCQCGEDVQEMGWQHAGGGHHQGCGSEHHHNQKGNCGNH